MLTQTRLRSVRNKAFHEELELEKVAFLATLARFAAKAVPMLNKAKPMLQQAGQTVSRFGAQHGNRSVGAAGKKLQSFGKANQAILSKSVKRPMLGLKTKTKNIRVIKKQRFHKADYLAGKQNLSQVGDLKFTKNPILAGKQRIGNLANNMASIQKNGLKNFLKKEFAASQRFTTTKNIGSSSYQVSAPRSIAGRVMSPTINTLPGMAALNFGLGGTDMQGKKVGTGKRAASALGDAAMWAGPFSPVTAPIFGTKVMLDMFKQSKKQKQGESINGVR